mgnify:CR=1 FL=1
MVETFTACSVDELDDITQELKTILKNNERNIVLLNGDLGAGKTSLVKNYVFHSNSEDEADSPTFSLVNDYKVKDGFIHHFDLYRLEDVEEIEDFGFWDYIDSKNLCFIEWADKIADLLPQHKVVKVDISLNLKQCREFTISY